MSTSLFIDVKDCNILNVSKGFLGQVVTLGDGIPKCTYGIYPSGKWVVCVT